MSKRSFNKRNPDKAEGKPWFYQSGLHKYGAQPRSKNRTFLIVCEGQTEELYFKAFPVITAVVKPIHGGSSKTALVDSVAGYRKQGSYDEIWCVFDLDIDPLIPGQFEDFNRAIDRAKKLGYHCGYSIDSFELWFLLHYQYLDQEQHRDFFNKMLSERWEISYEREGKTRRFARTIYARLQEDQQASQEKAIRHGKRLFNLHDGKSYHLQNPVTTVFELVERLNQHCRR